MKTVVEYNPTDGTVTFSDGTISATAMYGLALEPYEGKADKELVLSLAKQGYSAEELVELKKQGVL